MIIDYNYKPHVEYIPLGATMYVPRSPNNKGFIYFNGQDDLANEYLPTVVVPVATGGTAGISFPNNLCISGSISDSFMQFKRDSSTSSASTRTTDIAMFIDSTISTRASFYPINYLYINFNTTPGSLLFTVRPLIITLY
jgi:hypothetical protein